MTKHVKIETRSDPINPPDDIATATAAVEEIRTAATAFETRQTEALRAANDRIAALETRLNRPGTQQETANQPSDEQRSFGVYLRRGDAGLSEVERRALTVGNDTSAGFLAPETFGNEILKSIAEYSPIRNYAKVVQIAGPEIKYPKRLTGTNADWVSEIANRPESTPTYGQLTLTPYELATFVEVSKQLLEDAAYNVEDELKEAIGEDFGAKEGAAFVSGDGIGKPKGILVASGIPEVVSGHASTLGSAPGDLLIDLMAKLPTAYANNGAWLMNRLTLASVRKLKDSQGAYLWQPGIQAGQPSTLLGRPVIEAVDMDSVAAGKFPIVFGDWSGYRIVDRVGLSILTDPFTRAKNGITVFHARKRVGGDVTHADKFVKLKIAAS